MNKEIIPWVEKYRPSNFNNIILDKWNKRMLNNIIEQKYFPNVLFYGPPGIGKTTTIINIIKLYQERNNEKGKDLIIHLNASDDRGIDVIRNQIHNFVKTSTLFNKGMKFVILDEVDYMTKNAQLALKKIIDGNNKNVRFCLICNYISKIHKSIQKSFINFKFNNLPKTKIIFFLKEICKKENLELQDSEIQSIQEYFKSDIRSMINYIQTNKNNIQVFKLIDKSILTKLFNYIKSNNIQDIEHYIDCLSIKYNICIKELLEKFIYFLYDLKKLDLSNISFVIHNIEIFETNNLIRYISYKLKTPCLM